MDHDEYECPGCPWSRDYRIAVEVYGCRAGHHCTHATPEQRIGYEQQIAELAAALRTEHPEAA